VLAELIFSMGWCPLAILMLQQIVDPSIISISVAIFLFIQNVINAISAKIMGDLCGEVPIYVDYDKNLTTAFGGLMTFMTALPALLSIPFFAIAGYQLRSKKRAMIISGQITKEQLI